jgi:carbamoyl-phosphate synthase large subunit
LTAPASPRPVVLVTAAGGAGTGDVLASLAATDRYRLVAMDAAPHTAAFSLASTSYVVPFASDPRFPVAVRSLLEREQPDFVVTTVDEEIPVFHALANERQDMRVVTARPAFCDAMLDKWTGMTALRDARVPVPRTWLASGAPDDCYPAVIKPRVGRGSRGVRYLDGPEALEHYLHEVAADPDDFIVQEQVRGQEFTVSGVVALGGPLLAVVPKEVIVKQGVTRVGITRRVPAIEAVCARLQERLRADGPFNAQLILTEDGTPYIFEVNPRYSTTTALTIAAGLNEVDVVIRHALGEHPGELTFQPDLAMLRHTTASYVCENEMPRAVNLCS